MNSLSILSEKVDRHLKNSLSSGQLAREPTGRWVWRLIIASFGWIPSLFKRLSRIRSLEARDKEPSLASDLKEQSSHTVEPVPLHDGGESLRRSVRIKLHSNEDQLAHAIKSPTSPSASSDILNIAPPPVHRALLQKQHRKKTLVLDLDETLIHSLAKGGKMSSGHMVEVKLDKHAILYYVHKRPYCDEFLRKASKWFHVVIFTASVQEYADPVIDWLEQERKYFKDRYYRQHCTFRNGAYIKDLSYVDKDLSRVLILDNSPMSYMYQEGRSLILLF